MAENNSDNDVGREEARDNSPVAAELPASRRWERRGQALAAVFWPSFLAAAFATMLFFAFVDPQGLQLATTLTLGNEDRSVYSVLFFFFWMITLVASGLSIYLMYTRKRRRRVERNARDGANG